MQSSLPSSLVDTMKHFYVQPIRVVELVQSGFTWRCCHFQYIMDSAVAMHNSLAVVTQCVIVGTHIRRNVSQDAGEERQFISTYLIRRHRVASECAQLCSTRLTYSVLGLNSITSLDR